MPKKYSVNSADSEQDENAVLAHSPETGERILLLMKPVDAKAIRKSLEQECIQAPKGDLLATRPDLVIADTETLRTRGNDLQALKSATPDVLLPVLLAVRPGGFDAAARKYGDSVEDLVRAPVTQVELRTRVRSLLRMRSLSISQHQALQARDTQLAGAERALAALSATNEQVIRAKTKKEMLDRVCHAIVTSGGYLFAWIGEVKPPPDKLIRPIVQSGTNSPDTAKLELSWGDDATGCGPAGRAVKSGRLQVSNHYDTDPTLEPWRELSTSYDVKSVAAVPISLGKAVRYVLAIYSGQHDAFDENECELLMRLSDNLGHGLAGLEEHRRRVSSEQRAIEIANRDNLTGFANRKAAQEELKRLADDPGSNREAALLFIDLDGFKLVNDALGHSKGDEVLVEIARRLDLCVRENDLLARQGGDEFLILIEPDGPGNDGARNTGERVAKRLISAIEEPLDISGTRYHLSASVGISLFPHDATEPSELLAAADSAMYAAKCDDQLSYCHFSRELGERQRHRLTLEQRLRTAVDGNDLEVYYQPIVDIQTGSIAGVEALLRWFQDDGSAISPGEFIPVAEETGLIVPIGDWVMEQTVMAVSKWRRAGFDVRGSVNLSARQSKKNDLTERLSSIVRRYSEQARHFDIELTESALMHDVDAMGMLMKSLSEAGFIISIDDFGTGYSSLARLKTMPIRKLKVDKSFIDDIPGSLEDTSLVRTIVQLAKNLELEIVAEGIETPAQRELLAELECDWGQGFLFAKPMPEAELTKLLKNGNPLF